MNAFINKVASSWYHITILGMYGFMVFYLGHLSINGWEEMAQVLTFGQSLMVAVCRTIVTTYICTKVAFLAFDAMYPEGDSYARLDVWFYLANFALVVHVAELAIVDILLHGI